MQDVFVQIAGAARSYCLAAPADPDAVLDEVAAAAGASCAAQSVPVSGAKGPPSPISNEPHMPYWAMVWASGLALAELVLSRRYEGRGRRALELGCGLGVTATAALEAGTRLWVADCFAEALAFCRYNARRNTDRAPSTLLADWRTAAGRRRLARAGSFDLVLAADVLYEPEDVAPLLALVPELLTPGGVFWLAEPGRATSARFVAAAAAAGWTVQSASVDRAWPAGAGWARVGLHRYTLPREI